MLKMKDAETTIILVSDGIETCGGDPCQVVEQLKKTGVKFILHVVGFHVNLAAEQQLKCAAGAGGGRYFAANDADQLLTALKAVSAEVQEKVQKVDPAMVDNVPKGFGLGKLKVSMPMGSEVSLRQIVIAEPESGTVKRTVDKPAPDGVYPFPSGTYAVSLHFATPNYGESTVTPLGNVTVVKGKTKELKLGSVSFNLPPELEEELSVAEVRITDAGTNIPVVTVRSNGNGYYNFRPKPIGAGVYNIVIQSSRKDVTSMVASNVVVQAGKDTVVTLNSGIQVKEANDILGWELRAVETRNVDDLEESDAVTTDVPTLKIIRDGFGNNSRLWNPYIVLPGTYRLNLYLKGMDEALPASDNIVIKPGALIQFNAGL